MSAKNQMTKFSAAVATGVLVAAGTSVVSGDEPTAATPRPFVSTAAPYATPNTLYRPVALAASGFPLIGNSGGAAAGATHVGTFFSGGSGTVGPVRALFSQFFGGGSTSLFFAPTIFANGAPGAKPGGGGPAAGSFTISRTAATLLSPTQTSRGGGGLIGFFIGDGRRALELDPIAPPLCQRRWRYLVWQRRRRRLGGPGGNGGLIFGDGGARRQR